MKDQTTGTSPALSLSSEDRNTADLRRNIEEQKEAIAGTIHQIDQRIQRSTDWRAQVSDHALLSVGVAFVAGGLMSAFFTRKPTPRERMLDALAESFEDVTCRVRNRVVAQLTSSVTTSVVKAVGAALVAKLAAAYVSEKLNGEPRFADQDHNN